MTPRRVHLITGFLSGFVANMFLSALLLAWPYRTIGLVLVVGLAFIVMMQQGNKPPQRWHIIASGFILGYALFSALLAALDLIFPALT
jgi:hypothetical protein